MGNGQYLQKKGAKKIMLTVIGLDCKLVIRTCYVIAVRYIPFSSLPIKLNLMKKNHIFEKYSNDCSITILPSTYFVKWQMYMPIDEYYNKNVMHGLFSNMT